jgi:LysR family hydrogen peroxide-inducible transcriptional activator
MTLQMLRYLVEAADAGTLRGAADACGVSQPTLSAQLAKLEDELDAILLERGRHGVRLTAAGQRALAHARSILHEVDRLRAACRTVAQPLAGPLHLGVIPTAGMYLMPRLLKAIQHHHPRAELHLREEVTAQLLHRLREGELDAAITSLPIEATTLTWCELLTEPFDAIVPADHALASRRRIARRDLQDVSLLLLEDGHCLREQTASFCQMPAGRRGIQATSVESLRQMVAGGLGCSLLPRMAVTGRHARAAGVVVIPIEPPAPTRKLVLVWRTSHAHFGALRQLARTLAAALQ